ncbi:MAG: 3-hydroxyacyl-CoA dehydrogenase [Pseudomonadota bacterium]
MKISDQVFIVTGAASGLGEATARMIVEEGGKVVLADLQVNAGQRLAAELGAVFVPCDVTQEDDGKRVVGAALALGALRGLINCAGVAPAAKTVGKNEPHSLIAFQNTININLVGSFNMARLAADAMTGNASNDDGERGVIIHTASIAAYDGQVGQVAYAASKAGIVGLTLPMARDLARYGIRVMTIAPGIFETPLVQAMPVELQDALSKTAPFPSRLGRPSEFAHLVKAILENAMLNGETIRLDGAVRMPPK